MAGQDGGVKDPYDLSKNPSLADLFRAHERKIKLEIRTSIPATVVSFNPAPVPGPVPPGTGGNATVTVLVSTLSVNRVANSLMIPKTAVLVNLPRREATNAPVQLVNIPVEFPGSQSGGLTWNILPGDTGRLIVSDRCMARWLADGVPHDPVMATTHGLVDSVFVPGLRSLASALGVVDITATVLEGTTLVKLGGLAVESVTKAESLLLALINAVTATATVPMDGGASFKTSLLAQLALIQAQIGTPAGVGSVKVKVE